MDGVSWFNENLAIAGFSEELAAFTTARELIENGIDASRHSSFKKIEIELNQLDSFLEISVSDWGHGMTRDTVDSFTCLFQSSASAGTGNGSFRIGRFGVGLKLAALNSQRSTGRPLQVTSGGVTFSFDSESVKIMFPANISASTRVTACAQISPNFVATLSTYLASLRRNLPAFEISLIGNFPLQISDHKYSPSVESEISSTNFHISATLEISNDGNSDLEISRSVNEIPIFADFTCSIFRGISAAIRQSEFSLGLKFSPDSRIYNNFFILVPFSGSGRTASFSGSCGADTPGTMKIRVNLKSEKVEYGNLSKSSVVGDVVISLVSKCVVKLLVAAKNKFPGFFRSEDDIKDEAKKQVWLPALGEALASLLLRREESRRKAEQLMSAEHLEAEAVKKRIVELVLTGFDAKRRRRS